MTKHYEARIHWQKLYAVIKEYQQKGVAIYELADKFGVEKNDAELEKTIVQLTRQGRIRSSIGSHNGAICRFVQITKET